MSDIGACRVLLVDDSEPNLDILVETLGDIHEVAVATDGLSALDAVAHEPPDLILLDIMMPGMDGYEVCRRLKHDPASADIPVVFLTAKTELEDKTKGFRLGAVDYITKPFETLEVRARVQTHLALVLARREVHRQNQQLEVRVAERTKELVLTQDVTIHSLTTLCETRDNDTGGHILRTQHYVLALARRLAAASPYADELDARTVELFFKSAPLHDIGKVGVPDAILFKPSGLTDDEFAIMRSHCEVGYMALEKSERLFRAENVPSFLAHAKDIAYTHHEHWDGTGYPRGLKGVDIPLSGRIMAMADVYDALVCRRVYKRPTDHVRAVEMIVSERGKQFDPVVVDAFLDIQDQFEAIARDLVDDVNQVSPSLLETGP